MRFLVYELLSILYFTFNSDLRLGRLAGKQGSVAPGNMPLTLTCSDQGINPKACEVHGRCSGGGCEGGEVPVHKKKSLQISAKFRKKKIQNRSYLKN